jgi:hypothetical protein
MNQLKKALVLVALSAAAVGVANAQGSGGPEASYLKHVDAGNRNHADAAFLDSKATATPTAMPDQAMKVEAPRMMQMAKAPAWNASQIDKIGNQGH